MSKDEKADMKWMYDGTKAIVNREDYLLGKKVDKNLQLYSDTIKAEHEGGIATITSSLSTSASRLVANAKQRSDNSSSSQRRNIINLDIVRKEDPLVAIKIKEENIKREILENPVRMRRLQNVVRATFEKKMRKAIRNEKKKKRRKHDRSSSSSSSSSPNTSRRKPSTTLDNTSDSETKRDKNRQQQRSQQHSSRRRSSSYSDSDDERKRKKFAGYGLVTGKSMSSANTKDSVERRHQAAAITSKDRSSGSRRPEKKLSKDEMDRLREEMVKNARWRDEQRSAHLQRCEARDRSEAESDKKKSTEATDFIRPMLNAAASDKSLEERLNSNRKNVQRAHGHMDSNSFVRR